MNKPKSKPEGTRQQAWKLRLYPNQAQELAIVQHRGGSVCVYNWAIEQYGAGWKTYREAVAAMEEQGLVGDELKAAKKTARETSMPNRFALSRDLTQIKKTEPIDEERDYRWLADVQSQTQTQALIDAERAVARFRKNRREAKKSGAKLEDFPHFRSARRNESFRYQQGVGLKTISRVLPDGSQAETWYIYLPKIGWVRYRAGKVPEGTITQATVKREAGKWYCLVFTDRIALVEPVAPVTAEGVLLGVDAIVTTSSGLQTLNPQYLERDLERLARAQRDLARKQGGRKTGKPNSKNRIKAVKRVQRIHARIANCRADTAHKLSHGIVRDACAVVTQDADFRAEQAAPAPKARHRKMADAGRGQIRSQLAYKSGWAGKSFVTVESREDSGDSKISLSARASAVRAAGLAVLASSGGQMPVENAE